MAKVADGRDATASSTSQKLCIIIYIPSRAEVQVQPPKANYVRYNLMKLS